MRRFECKTTQPSWRREPLDRATAASPRLSTLVRARLPCRRRLLARSRPPRGSPPRSPPLASPPRHTLASGSPRLSSPRLSPPAPRFMLASVLNARLASHPRFLARSPRLLTHSLVSSPPARSPHLLSSRSSPCSRTRLGRSRPSCEKKEWVKKKEWGVVSLEKLAVAPTSYGKKNLVSGGCNRHVRRCWCCHSDPDS